MKIVAKCTECKTELKIKSLFVANRIDLAKEKGEEFEVRCPDCGHICKIYVDEVYAEKNLTLIYIVGGISFLLAIGLIYFFWQYGYIATVSISIPILLSATINQKERNKVRVFNDMYYNSKKRLERLKLKWLKKMSFKLIEKPKTETKNKSKADE